MVSYKKVMKLCSLSAIVAVAMLMAEQPVAMANVMVPMQDNDNDSSTTTTTPAPTTTTTTPAPTTTTTTPAPTTTTTTPAPTTTTTTAPTNKPTTTAPTDKPTTTAPTDEPTTTKDGQETTEKPTTTESTSSGGGLGSGAIIGIVVGVVVLLGLVGFMVMYLIRKSKAAEDEPYSPTEDYGANYGASAAVAKSTNYGADPYADQSSKAYDSQYNASQGNGYNDGHENEPYAAVAGVAATAAVADSVAPTESSSKFYRDQDSFESEGTQDQWNVPKKNSPASDFSASFDDYSEVSADSYGNSTNVTRTGESYEV